MSFSFLANKLQNHTFFYKARDTLDEKAEMSPAYYIVDLKKKRNQISKHLLFPEEKTQKPSEIPQMVGKQDKIAQTNE